MPAICRFPVGGEIKRIKSYIINFFGMRDPKHGDNIDSVDYLHSLE